MKTMNMKYVRHSIEARIKKERERIRDLELKLAFVRGELSQMQEARLALLAERRQAVKDRLAALPRCATPHDLPATFGS